MATTPLFNKLNDLLKKVANKTTLTSLIIVIIVVVIYQSQQNTSSGAQSTTPSQMGKAPNGAEPLKKKIGKFPQHRTINGKKAIVHAPQVRSWAEFKEFESVIAVEFFPNKNDKPVMLTSTLSGNTEVNIEQRLVQIIDAKITDVYAGELPTPSYAPELQSLLKGSDFSVSLDLFLAYLTSDVLDDEGTANFNLQAPAIQIVNTPSISLFIPEKPFYTDIANTELQLVQNANFPLIFEPEKERYFMLYKSTWLLANELDGEWQQIQTLPKSFANLDNHTDYKLLADAIPIESQLLTVPAVIYNTQPTELIVIDGKEQLIEIKEADGLSYVENSTAHLFSYQNNWYYLTAGRWFTNDTLTNENWQFVKDLPSVFQLIPQDHKMAAVRSSIRGTIEARMAVLELKLPISKKVAKGQAPTIKVIYDGEPNFEIIPTTSIKRATNSPNDVFLIQDNYYLVYQGAWYQSSSASGPWTVTADVPETIYNIPPSSPSYSATNVKVASSTPQEVIYTYSPSYESDTYIYLGVPVYSTGYYYWPYYGAIYWYYPRAYGYDRFYNPNTGSYGWRSSWYGPFGGYSYGEGYNPNTGRMGYRETAWDDDEWESYGEVYNPRTGVTTETHRYYNEDSERYELERNIEGQHRETEINRTVDVDDQWSESSRENSRGGQTQMEREWDDDGSLTSSGTIEAADGRSADVSGNYQDSDGRTTIKGSEGGQGTIDRNKNGDNISREGSFTDSEGKTYDTESNRNGRDSSFEGKSSTGGELKSISNNGERTTVGKNDQGDVFAGHNGEVYKKTGDGWQKYDPDSGNWQSQNNANSITTERAKTEKVTNRPSTNVTTREPRSNSTTTTTQRQLDIDAKARQQGNRSFERRSSSRASSRGGLLRRRR